jgi:hypothetical protein
MAPGVRVRVNVWHNGLARKDAALSQVLHFCYLPLESAYGLYGLNWWCQWRTKGVTVIESEISSQLWWDYSEGWSKYESSCLNFDLGKKVVKMSCELPYKEIHMIFWQLFCVGQNSNNMPAILTPFRIVPPQQWRCHLVPVSSSTPSEMCVTHIKMLEQRRLLKRQPMGSDVPSTRHKSHRDGSSLYYKLDHMGHARQFEGPSHTQPWSAHRKGPLEMMLLSGPYNTGCILWVWHQYIGQQNLCAIVDHGIPLSINTKSRVAIKRHADITRKRNHCLHTCSGMYSLHSGPREWQGLG